MTHSAQFFRQLRILSMKKDISRRLGRRLGRDMDREVGSTRFASIPKIVWMYWHQGWEDAPELVKRCREIWERQNPGWTVRALDKTTAAEFIGDVHFPEGTSIAAQSDVLRLRLLSVHGGVWADATTLCQTPLDHWLPPAACRGFFAFSRPFRDRLVSNWFLAAAPGDTLASAWLAALVDFWRRPKAHAYVYAIAHYMLEALIRSDNSLRAEWEAMPKISAQPSHVCQHHFKGACSREDVVRLINSGGAVVHKLTYKHAIEPDKLDWLIAQITQAGVAGTPGTVRPEVLEETV